MLDSVGTGLWGSVELIRRPAGVSDHSGFHFKNFDRLHLVNSAEVIFNGFYSPLLI